MKSLQDKYNLIAKGEGNKELFVKDARALLPNIITNVLTYEQAVHNLIERGIIQEHKVLTGVLEPTVPDWFKIFNENIHDPKATLKDPDKDIVEKEVTGFNYKNKADNNNISTLQMLTGYYVEMKDPKHAGKTEEEIKQIVFKNLQKDALYYVKDGQFGLKGVGYTDQAPGLGHTKEVTGKYKSSGMEPVKLNEAYTPYAANHIHSRGTRTTLDYIFEDVPYGNEYYNVNAVVEVEIISDSPEQQHPDNPYGNVESTVIWSIDHILDVQKRDEMTGALTPASLTAADEVEIKNMIETRFYDDYNSAIQELVLNTNNTEMDMEINENYSILGNVKAKLEEIRSKKLKEIVIVADPDMPTGRHKNTKGKKGSKYNKKQTLKEAESMTAEEVIDKLKKGQIKDLTVLPADKELADKVLKLLNKPENKEIKKEVTKTIQQVQGQLQESKLRNTLFGLLAAGLVAGAGAMMNTGNTSAQTKTNKAQTTQTTGLDVVSQVELAMNYYKNHKSEVDKLAQTDEDVQFAVNAINDSGMSKDPKTLKLIGQVHKDGLNKIISKVSGDNTAYMKETLSEAKKRAIEKHIKEIEKLGEVAAIDHKISKIDEKIAEIENRITVTESDDMKEMVDKKAVNELRKDIKYLQSKRKMYEGRKSKLQKGTSKHGEKHTSKEKLGYKEALTDNVLKSLKSGM